jgi:hypothetical protein
MTPSTEDWLIASSVITEEKIKWAINGFSLYKTTSEDGIFPGLLQQGIETLVVPLCKILTACLTLAMTFGYVPKTWQKVRIIFIPKQVWRVNWPMRQFPRGFFGNARLFLRMRGILKIFSEAFLKISILFEDIFREIESFLINVKIVRLFEYLFSEIEVFKVM